MSQITDTILMIRPTAFGANPETAVNNYFQQELEMDQEHINERVHQEFDAFVQKLRDAGVNVIVESDRIELNTPDSIFPNNWVSFHSNGDVGLYPMYAPSRRRERREEVINRLEDEGFVVERFVDYTAAEDEGVYLEGTGSVIMDRVNKVAYCALSDRAHEELFIEFCEDFEYTPVVFQANQSVDGQRLAIYHTNVMMCLGEAFCVICLDSIDDKSEKKNVVSHLKRTGKEIIAITESQMANFAGNMLHVKSTTGESIIVMSQAARDSLRDAQVQQLEKHGTLLSSSLTTIETGGGGSARCMMAEVFLPKS